MLGSWERFLRMEEDRQNQAAILLRDRRREAVRFRGALGSLETPNRRGESNGFEDYSSSIKYFADLLHI